MKTLSLFSQLCTSRIKIRCFVELALLFLIMLPLDAMAAAKAFPLAKGHGAATRGAFGKPDGQGGFVQPDIVKVSTAAELQYQLLYNPNPRLVILEKGGNYELNGNIEVIHPYMTLTGVMAGQANGDGACIYNQAIGCNAMIKVATHDVIIRFIRFRSKYINNNSAFAVWSGAHDVIIDHCSFSWGDDQVADIYNKIYSTAYPTRITYSYNMIAQALDTTRHIGCGSLAASADLSLEMTDLDFHHNYWGDNARRNPCTWTGGTQLLNNIVYNWRYNGFQLEANGILSVVGCYLKEGPAKEDENAYYTGMSEMTWKPNHDVTEDLPTIYMKNNIGPNAPNGSDVEQEDMWEQAALTHWGRTTPNVKVSLPSGVISTTTDCCNSPTDPDNEVPIYNPLTLDTIIMPTVGCACEMDATGLIHNGRDTIDYGIFMEYYNNTGPAVLPGEGYAEENYPTYNPGTTMVDSDDDGMPDSYETATGVTDPYADSDGDGYTNIEEMLNGSFPDVNEEDCIALYRFNEGVGNYCYDEIHQNHANMYNCTRSYGWSSRSVVFNGIDSVVIANHMSAYDRISTNDKLTVVAIIYTPASPKYGQIVAKSNWYLQMNTTGTITMGLKNDQNQWYYINGTNTLKNNTFYIVAGIYQKNGTSKIITIEKDGPLVESGNVTYNYEIPTNTNQLRIGKYFSAWQGRVDEVRIYAAALDQWHIKNLIFNPIN